ncbi:PH domain-containing protein [Lentzea terrae]|uniref:PH domain-containing protein n=1 Tax=Lentzea terrae TaxID=2200761 RepID=UPI0013003C34|nr:PH domain-containing protein [Lentzea terrae]
MLPIALVFLLIGIATIVNAATDEVGALIFGLAAGIFGTILGGYGAWRSLIAGVKYSPDGIEVRNLERTRRISWDDVDAVEVRHTHGDILVFLRQADIVLVLKSGEEDWLSSLAVYNFSSSVPKRTQAKADALRAALDLHRRKHIN